MTWRAKPWRVEVVGARADLAWDGRRCGRRRAAPCSRRCGSQAEGVDRAPQVVRLAVATQRRTLAQRGLVDLDDRGARLLEGKRLLADRQRQLPAALLARLVVAHKDRGSIVTGPVSIALTRGGTCRTARSATGAPSSQPAVRCVPRASRRREHFGCSERAEVVGRGGGAEIRLPARTTCRPPDRFLEPSSGSWCS